jgi:hypothetical protein
MGALEQAIERAILKISGKSQVKQVLSGVAIDVGELTCTVKREGAPSLFDVRLNAIDDDLDNYLTVYPAEGSAVLVAIIENMKTEAVVIRCSEVKKVKAKIGTTELELDSSGFGLNRANQNLKDVISDLIAEIQKIIVLTGITPNVVALEAIKTRMKTILK